MALNFGSLATTQTSSSSNYLRPWNIYSEVKFGGVEGPFSGTSAKGNSWTAYDFKFESKDGNYTERIFEPVEASTERRKVTNNQGHESELPSDFERTMAFLAQVGNVYNPEGFKKLQAASSKVSSFGQLIEVFKKCIGTPDTTTNLKLAGRNSNGTVYAGLPTFVRINGKTGEVFTSDNFLGDKVAFSSWELSKKAEYENAKPTTPKSDPALDSVSDVAEPAAAEGDDIDLDSLGL